MDGCSGDSTFYRGIYSNKHIATIKKSARRIFGVRDYGTQSHWKQNSGRT
jgi:hypothetical protein